MKAKEYMNKGVNMFFFVNKTKTGTCVKSEGECILDI